MVPGLRDLLKTAASIVLIGLAANCKQPTVASDSDVKSLAFNPDAKNLAVVFGSPRDLPGVDVDVNETQSLLNQNPYRFEVRPKFRATRQDILSMTRQAASEVSNDGTLAVVFSGHGARSGEWAAEDAMVRFADVANEVRSAKPNLKRLLVVVDACFSGQLADGQDSNSIALTSDKGDNDYTDELNVLVDEIITEADSGAALTRRPGFGLQEAKNMRLAEQTFVIASSTRDQTSGATSRGSVFLMTMIRQLKSANDSTTFRQIADQTVSIVNSSGRQRPVYRAAPTTLLEEPVRGRTNQQGPGPVTPPQALPQGPLSPAQPQPLGPFEPLGMPEQIGSAPALPISTSPGQSPGIGPRPPSPAAPQLGTSPSPAPQGRCVCRQVGSECQLLRGTQVISRSPESDPNACAQWACNPTGGRFRAELNGPQCR